MSFCIFQALTVNNNIKIHKINPKAQSRSQLLGKVDLDTRQWIDGIISKAAQQAYSENNGKNNIYPSAIIIIKSGEVGQALLYITQ